MTDRTVPADERALRRELQELTKKREVLNSSKRRGSTTLSGGVAGRRSVFDRLGGEPTRTGSTRHVQLKENKSWGNPSRNRGKRDPEDNHQSSAFKRQRLHSAVTRPDGANDLEKTEANGIFPLTVSPSVTSARAQERKQRAVAPYAQKDGIARSRRMFGALMGHLSKAKRQIEKDTNLFKRQDTKQQEAEQKEKMQSQYLEHQARLDAEMARLEALVARTGLDRSEEVARAKLEHLQTVRKSASQSKFLLTISSPPIYYLPAKHTKETKELVAASMEAHEAKMKASVQTHEETVRKREAEYVTKLETLYDQLETIKKERTAGEQVLSTKKDDVGEDEDEDMNDGSNECEKDEKEGLEHGGDDMSDGPRRDSQMDAENEEMVQRTMSNSEVDKSVSEGRSEIREIDDKAPMMLDTSDRKEDTQAVNDSRRDLEVSSFSREEETKSVIDPEEEAVEILKQQDEVAVHELRDDAEHQNVGDSVVENKDAETELPDVCTEKSTAHVPKMKVAELRAELRKRGLDSKGLKATLVLRLQQAIIEDK